MCSWFLSTQLGQVSGLEIIQIGTTHSIVRFGDRRVGASPSLIEQANEHKKVLDAILSNDERVLNTVLGEHIVLSVLIRLNK